MEASGSVNEKITSGLKKTTNSLAKNYKFIIILLIAAIFIAAAYYVFKKYVRPKLDANWTANKEFTSTSMNEDDEGVADLYMFKVDWCPHCKKALPIWEDLAQEYQGKKINGYKMNFITVDGEADPDTTDKYNVQGYPTIKLVKDNQIIEYDAKPDHDTLLQFLNSTL
jgi:thiol-disulfide isomerase/thioredoxin